MEETRRIESVVEVFNEYKQWVQKQKARGINDFNIFTTLLDKSDEVRLHSRFLAYLLNPQEDHYQDELFLEFFLEKCNIKSLFPDLKRCAVYSEYEHIDIYITDGSSHLILENKIWAADQAGQIARYIQNIVKKSKLQSNNVACVYLTLDDKPPSNESLTSKGKSFRIGNDNGANHLINSKDEEEKYRFYTINYENHILPWLEKCHKEIANITNLSVGITQYTEVVQKLCGKYKEKQMNIYDYIQGKDNKKELAQTFREIYVDYPKFESQVVKDFFVKAKEMLEKKSKLSGWEIETHIDDFNNIRKKSASYFFSIGQNKDSEIVFGFEFQKTNFSTLFFGITSRYDGKGYDQRKIIFVGNESSALKNVEDKLKVKAPQVVEDKLKEKETERVQKLATTTTPHWGWPRNISYENGSLTERITKDGDKAVDNFVNTVMEVFEQYHEVVELWNQKLEQEKS